MDASDATARAEDLLDALRPVIDPELGISIVELGLVSRAAWQGGAIDIALTPSTPSCPLVEVIRAEAELSLRARFPEAAAVRIELVWDPPWSPERLSEEARRMLGLAAAG